jgi:broad specificity phosphatase PhoE
LRTFYLITHPNVAIDPAVPVPDWPLSPLGRRRMTLGLAQPWIGTLTAIYASGERKARDGAEILARHLGCGYRVDPDLGENDRSSTGFLPPAEFEAVADEFFAMPDRSVRGWERAVDAQRRVAGAVARIDAADTTRGSIALVAHGGVGTLLYCHLAGLPISRTWDQPPSGGGNFFSFTLSPTRVHSHWLPFG